MSDEQKDVWIGAPSADAGDAPPDDEPEPESEDEEEK